MFASVLIANRGAIATRIIRTLRQMQIRSVAIYADSDADSLHVQQADAAFSLGDGPATDTYLDMDRILGIAAEAGVDAIHPGYGFLSENPAFVQRCEAAGIAFIGPTAEQMRLFGLKHEARNLARQAGVPLVPGTGLLNHLDDALSAARDMGYPVMLKSTAGGGGIGMQRCAGPDELERAFASVKRLGANNFANDGVFLEKFIDRARHIEVQIFGDGQGQALAIGERDCSSQRRNQKVVEECPAPGLDAATRAALHQTAERLLSSVRYRNAGTVEFIHDADRGNFYFLEVNTRLQVEHGVTEAVYGMDLVAWMIRLAAGCPPDLDTERDRLAPNGHAIQVRVYAEDPCRHFQPCAGLLSTVKWPLGDGVRIDHWIESGTEVPPWFDPMLAKVIVHDTDRASALARLQQTLDQCVLYGIETNLDYLRALVRDPVLASGRVTTRWLDNFVYHPNRVDVVHGGTQTTIQDAPGRQGFWHVGVPPSGPFDSLSFRLANRLLNNADDAAGLEITLQGPSLYFHSDSRIVLAGAPIDARLDNQPLPLWQVLPVRGGQTLSLGRIGCRGARSYLCIAGGLDCPPCLGARATFTLGQFGGHNGRALRAGDVLRIPPVPPQAPSLQRLPTGLVPEIGHDWTLRVIYGPQGAPDFFTEADIQTFFDHHWEVHYHSSRTGIRLIGPKPGWARRDGAEAGLHPSNIHDNAYAFGTVDFTGDMPVILGPDGPSLGGFVCPATVIQADLWKLGQLRAGDRVRFVCVGLEDAVQLEADQNNSIHRLMPVPRQIEVTLPDSPVLACLSGDVAGTQVVYRVAGDHFLLVEYGEQVLDIELRFRVHALMQWLQAHPLEGMRELTPGIRSLQVHYDSQRLNVRRLLAHLQQAEQQLGQHLTAIRVPSRIVHLPLSWDDEACRQAIDKYDQSVRKDAPWCPSNLEFIRRINGLDSIDAVRQIVFGASYLVMGLGDVYLGAPVATPIDPRHRLVTTKYNPARTWTAENSVGIGGAYLCVYGMEGPGGYQFVGRTLQMWNRYRQTRDFPQPWLLRFFDQIRFYEVSHEALQTIRQQFPRGQYPLKIEDSHFSLAEYRAMLQDQAPAIESFQARRQQAFDAELARWHNSGQFNFEPPAREEASTEEHWPEGSLVMDSPVSGSVWLTEVEVGQQVQAGERLLVLESMKMEIPIYAIGCGRVTHVLLQSGQPVHAGQPMVVLEETA